MTHTNPAAVVTNAKDRHEGGTLLLARATSGGSLELLSEAWPRLLGYGRGGLEGKALGSLLAAERRSDSGEERVIAALFDRASIASVELTLRCHGGRRQSLRLHRRLDPATGAIYIVGEAIPGPTGRPTGAAGTRPSVRAQRQRACPKGAP